MPHLDDDASTPSSAKQRPAYDLGVGPAEDRSATPFLWFFIGLGLGVGSLELIGLPVLVVSLAGLGVRAVRSRRTRHLADLAGLLLGAGVVIAFFVVPQILTPICSGTQGSGGCDTKGHCWSNGPTSCVDGHLFFIVAAAAAGLFVLGAGAIVVRLVKRSTARHV